MDLELIWRTHPAMSIASFAQKLVEVIALNPRIFRDVVKDGPIVTIQPIFAHQVRDFMLEVFVVEAVEKARDV